MLETYKHLQIRFRFSNATPVPFLARASESENNGSDNTHREDMSH